jgi:hypothetical protein
MICNLRLTWFGVVATAAVLVCVTHAADTDIHAFVGTWKENPAKSRHFISPTLTYTFTAEPDGFVSIVRANTPVHDRVRMDGKDYPGSGSRGQTVSWARVSDTVFESTIKRDGTLIASARWVLSDGGTHLRQETMPVRANGEDGTGVIEYVRTIGEGNTLIGEWKPLSTRGAAPDLFTVTLVNDELQVFYPKYGFVVYTMRLDAKRYPLTSPNAAPGSMSASEGLGARTVRHVTFLGEKPTLEAEMTVSPDGETMTVITRPPGSTDGASVIVYEKQH